MNRYDKAVTLFCTLLLAFSLFVVSTGDAPRITNFKGHSMEPFFNPGDQGLCKPQETYEIGDVVMFDDPDNRGIDVAHRIVNKTSNGFKTSGDNNDYIDPWTLKPENIDCQIVKVYGKT